jgi:hypothetical protein
MVMKGMKHSLAPPKEALDPQLDSLFNASVSMLDFFCCLIFGRR